MNIENLNSFEKDTLLRWFLHYMPMGAGDESEPTKATRNKLMRTYPEIYNKFCNANIVTVIHTERNEPV